MIKEPVIYQLGRDFEVVTNIRRADVQEGVGWVILELEGSEPEIERLITQGAVGNESYKIS